MDGWSQAAASFFFAILRVPIYDVRVRKVFGICAPPFVHKIAHTEHPPIWGFIDRRASYECGRHTWNTPLWRVFRAAANVLNEGFSSRIKSTKTAISSRFLFPLVFWLGPPSPVHTMADPSLFRLFCPPQSIAADKKKSKWHAVAKFSRDL